jgi:hypothetical protein
MTGDASPLSCHTDGTHDDSLAVSITHVSSVSQHVEPVQPAPIVYCYKQAMSVLSFSVSGSKCIGGMSKISCCLLCAVRSFIVVAMLQLKHLVQRHT